MSDEELKEAVSYWKSLEDTDIVMVNNGSGLAGLHLQRLLSFAESYLSHSEEWPEESKCQILEQIGHKHEGYDCEECVRNKTIQDCRLAMMKRVSVERIKEILDKEHYHIINENLAQTIYSAIVEGK